MTRYRATIPLRRLLSAVCRRVGSYQKTSVALDISSSALQTYLYGRTKSIPNPVVQKAFAILRKENLKTDDILRLSEADKWEDVLIPLDKTSQQRLSREQGLSDRALCSNPQSDCTQKRCRFYIPKPLITSESQLRHIFCALSAASLRNGGGLTLQEIAALFGVTRERIRQIEAGALEKLRNASTLEEFAEP